MVVLPSGPSGSSTQLHHRNRVYGRPLSSALGTCQLTGRCPASRSAQAVHEAQGVLLTAGLQCFPCALMNRPAQGLASSAPSAEAEATACCSWKVAVPEAGRPGTSL